jgi:hypothetical protein
MPASKWEVNLDPIELHHDGDEVKWNLFYLRSEYPAGTDFKIEFTSVCPHGGPIKLDKDSGPFAIPIGPSGGDLAVKGRNHEWGCYTYDIRVYIPGDTEGKPIEFPIDPQIDNLEPPPPPDPCRPDHPGGEGPGPKDR